MEPGKIKETVRNIVVKIVSEIMDVDTGEVEIEDDESLIEGGMIDSVNVMPLIEYFGAEFEIEVEPEELTLEYWDSINAIQGYIQMKLNE